MPRAVRSRNGCVTCKERRLKCDEAKPFCQRCQNSRVPCEGYKKKDFKWRVVDRGSIASLATKSRQAPRGASVVRLEDLNEENSPESTSPLRSAFETAAHAFEDLGNQEFDSSPTAATPAFGDPQQSQNDLSVPIPTPSTTQDNQPIGTSQAEPTYPTEADLFTLDSPSRFLHELFNSSPLDDLALPLFAQPSTDPNSPEMLMQRFSVDTCGILSVKDGPTENPWRTLIWPLSSSSPAVYHAVSSMAAAHASYDEPGLQLCSMQNRNRSIQELIVDIKGSRFVPVLATSLVLAFAEGWEEPVSSKFTRHLRGARGVLKSWILDPSNRLLLRGSTEQARLLRYLCNAFIYLDVISGLTDLEDKMDDDDMYEELVSATNVPIMDLLEVDPLLGCHASLFPLLAGVAHIAQQVYKGQPVTLQLISQAGELQDKLQRWTPPNAAVYGTIQDPSSQVRHAIHIADALRYAILLYLHQAVPEAPSESAASLSRKILVQLAMVPPTSRTTNLQIFALLIASCEVIGDGDRTWIKQRWLAMITRLRVRNVDCCWEIVQEVWARRDADAERGRATARIPDLLGTEGDAAGQICGQADTCSYAPEYKHKIGCKLHWLSVMFDRGWEVFVG
ncbi:fungal-specific transcription factor domain-containing protein [Aspergillus multicolor]|uniref:Zn(II)2Cys6 transcription factor n=1 Tax=Aspergillus multicolor TaxID=41759 RepID=UPI003CCCEA53